MNLGRRAVLKLGGGAVAASVGYAGYKEASGGSWLYDPESLTAARNKYFATIDYETLFELQEEYGDEDLEEVETPTGSTFDPTELDRLATVGSVSLSGDNGVPSGQTALAISGSFDAEIVEDAASESEEIEEQNTYEGYTLWEAPIDEELVDPLTAAQGSSGDGAVSMFSAESLLPDAVALGTRDGAVLTGTVVAPEAEIRSMDAVETMIDAKDGGIGSPDLLTADESYDSIRSQFESEPTFLFGAAFDPSTVSLALDAVQFALEAAGLAGEAADGPLRQWVEDLTAVAVGGNIDTDSETATLRTFLTYATAEDAEQTELVQLIDAASTISGARDVAQLDARYEGRSIVIEAEGDTDELFEQAEQTPTENATALLERQGLSG